jgi:hypothetical protein
MHIKITAAMGMFENLSLEPAQDVGESIAKVSWE